MMRSHRRIKKMDDSRIVYLIACGVLDRERITNAIGDDAKLKKLVSCGILMKSGLQRHNLSLIEIMQV